MKSISDEQLKAYFLGRLPEPEAETLEIECASDAELTAQAQDVERELTDDYLRGNLSAADIRLYESNYLITEARHKKLQVAAQLWKIANEPTPPLIYPVASTASPSSFWPTLFGQRRVFQLAFGGLFLLLAFGAVAFYLLPANVNNREVAEVEDPLEPPKPENPTVQSPADNTVQDAPAENQLPKSVPANPSIQNKEPEKETHAPSKNSPEVKAAATPKTSELKRAAMAMTVKLMPGSVRGEGDEQAFTIAPNVKNLNLLLSPAGEPNNYKIYRAVVKTPENNPVFTSPSLKSLSFTIPAEKLENRTYIIFLEGRNAENEFESIGEYTFRVRR
jgi:hypothetical protein